MRMTKWGVAQRYRSIPFSMFRIPGSSTHLSRWCPSASTSTSCYAPNRYASSTARSRSSVRCEGRFVIIAQVGIDIHLCRPLLRLLTGFPTSTKTAERLLYTWKIRRVIIIIMISAPTLMRWRGGISCPPVEFGEWTRRGYLSGEGGRGSETSERAATRGTILEISSFYRIRCCV